VIAFGSALGIKIPLMEGTLESNAVSAGD
jgi:hypothetical protein